MDTLGLVDFKTFICQKKKKNCSQRPEQDHQKVSFSKIFQWGLVDKGLNSTIKKVGLAKMFHQGVVGLNRFVRGLVKVFYYGLVFKGLNWTIKKNVLPRCSTRA